MASKGAYKRLTKEYLLIQKTPTPFIVAKPLESNILEWHYVITGPPDSPYEGGQYYGKLIFPADYPFKPPAIKMITPNGRFQTDFRLCLSMSDYHPGTWNPAWSVSTILTGLLSFMLEDQATTGSITTTLHEKRLFAKKSHVWNMSHYKFKDVFPDLCKKTEEALAVAAAASATGSSPPTSPTAAGSATSSTTSVRVGAASASLTRRVTANNGTIHDAASAQGSKSCIHIDNPSH
ncbi:ubiquitin-conjugating enzyme/RWD-like protein [Entophlyctis helioformis]|nr:ubiquitin-conjugating enzyme/RWD-like protein [Entophlyctis helioformis]